VGYGRESVRSDDIVEILKFLIPVGNAPKSTRTAQAAYYGVKKTCAFGHYTTKLTSAQGKELEKK